MSLNRKTPLTREKNDAMTPNIQYLDTSAAYDLWSEVYDTDGNFLQALDTIEMKTLLPSAISQLKTPSPWKAVDLGCGTGRNTIGLSQVLGVKEIIAMDLSPKMLDFAKQKLSEVESEKNTTKSIAFEVYDMINQPSPPGQSLQADLVISTLVLEHVPLDVFFRTAAMMLKTEGLLLMTNMHSEMGNISQAGFVDPKTGVKVRPVSYPHTVTDTENEAKRYGLELVAGIKEVGVDEMLVEKLGPRGTKWLGITVWFGGIWRKT